MKFFINLLFIDLNLLGLEKSLKILYRLQKHLFKSVYVLDRKNSLKIQKLILQSSYSRLFVIREVTQINSERRIPGVDGKTTLTFLERFELNEYLRKNMLNWFPQSFKQYFFINDNKTGYKMKVFTISDRAWQNLIKLALEPAHEAVFHPSNFGFRCVTSVFEIQNVFSLRIGQIYFASQKRILKIKLSHLFETFNINFLIKKLIAPRGIKLGLFRLLKKGLSLGYVDQVDISTNLICLLSNILLTDFESLHECLHCGNDIVFFLNPVDDEKVLVQRIRLFLSSRGLYLDKLSIEVFPAFIGFNFLDWIFKFNNDLLCSLPSDFNYRIFVNRVKHILNNSNYGSVVKVNKVYPIIKQWRLLNRFCLLKNSRYTLFFLKKRAFKTFNKESKQDFYSSKRLLDKCFYLLEFNEKHLNSIKINLARSIFKHTIFCVKPHIINRKNFFVDNCFCIHCGMKIFEC
uniref:Ycf13 n=1 Tax=Euglena clara TaxID=215708 RepID=A0A2Z4YXA1_9EUGL|nr:ycf13 [Euglena clara]AXA45468.1 ycf13 [Euglena clara]